MEQRTSTSLVHHLVSFCQLPLSNFNSSSGISSQMSFGWPWASSGSSTQEDGPFYPAPGHCECYIAGWWHSELGVMGPPLCSMIVHPASFIGRPKRPRVLSLPLVTMHWAQLLGIPHTSFATWLPRTSLVLLLLSQTITEPIPAAQRTPLSAAPSVPELMSKRSCKEEDWGLDLSGYKPFS